MWHFTVGKDEPLCCHENEWERHLVTKRWPFPCVIPRQGEDCSFIKLPEWLNAIGEHSESAHHHSMTVGKEARRQETRTK